MDLLLSFSPGVTIEEAAGGRRWLRGPTGAIALPASPPGVVAVASLLASGGATRAQIASTFREASAPDRERAPGEPPPNDAAVALALGLRTRLWWGRGFLRQTLMADAEPLAILVPMARSVPLVPDPVEATARWRLSRFAWLRRHDKTMTLESSRAPARMLLPGDAALAVIAALATPRSADELGALSEGPGPAATPVLLALLASAGLIEAVGAQGRLREDTEATLQQWEFHDQLFHTRSRLGRHHDPVGATFRFLDTRPPLPAIAPARTLECVALFTPQLDDLIATDRPFTAVVESRRSIRQFGESPITAQQLGEFLYRVARVRRVVPPNPSGGRPYEVTSRPYPSGGATYDLEVYVTVHRCAGVSEGLYHYAPLDHRLERISRRTADIDTLLQQAQHAAGLADPPQILVTLTSRFSRVSWKYASIAYATTLKNVGVLYQTMYLAATAMGLAPCALGIGNADLFARAAGTDYFAEPSVGEFILGSSASA